QDDFGIPIHHYVEVNFEGFKRLVDAIGGVSFYFAEPARDTHTGFEVLTPGCATPDGVHALAFARSRYYQTFTTRRWRDDESSDLGRIQRQQEFMRVAFQKALAAGSSNPFAANELINATLDNIKIDKNLDVFGLANRMRKLGSGGIKSWTMPAHNASVGNQSVLKLADAQAQPIV